MMTPLWPADAARTISFSHSSMSHIGSAMIGMKRLGSAEAYSTRKSL